MIISIIMPYYKGIHFLQDAMESLDRSLSDCKATEVSFELIVVVDDGKAKEDKDVYGFGADGCVMCGSQKYRDEALTVLDKYKVLFGERLTVNVIPVSGKYNTAMLRNEIGRASCRERV